MIKFPDMNLALRKTRISFSQRTKLSWSKHVKKKKKRKKQYLTYILIEKNEFVFHFISD